MIPEYSTKLFQCGSRCLSHRAICGDLAAPRQGGRSGNRERSDLTLHCHRRADRAVLQRHDRCVRVLSQAKSTLWCCRGDSSQTLKYLPSSLPLGIGKEFVPAFAAAQQLAQADRPEHRDVQPLDGNLADPPQGRRVPVVSEVLRGKMPGSPGSFSRSATLRSGEHRQ